MWGALEWGQTWRQDASEDTISMAQEIKQGSEPGNQVTTFSQAPHNHMLSCALRNHSMHSLTHGPVTLPCVGTICLFVIPPLPGWEHFSLLATLGLRAGSQLALMSSEGHGVWEEGHEVNAACGPVHEPNKTSRPSAHFPFCICP